ncbi:MAG TPA: DUF2959 domain-containing protein [Chromatiales bacterium]|nr:DUF2959 domain-containing protein [Chromatiales bacterium]
MKTKAMNNNILSSPCFRWGFVLASLLVLGACSTTYYAAWETVGKHKRDLLRDNIEAARDEQAEAQEQIKTAMERLKELQGFDGGDLEDIYEKLNDDYEEAVERAEDVSDRIGKIDDIANDLFDEWEEEIGLISNSRFKADSQKKLRATKKKYAALNRSMVKAEKRMDKVLVRFRDHVLYLKHNLNARAIGSLDAEVASIDREVKRLIADMQASIAEAEDFIATME